LSTEYRWILPGSVPTDALLLTRLVVTLRGTGSRTRTSARLTRLLIIPALRYPSETYVSGRNHKGAYAGCIVSLATPLHLRSVHEAGLLPQRCGEAGNREPTSGLKNRLPLLQLRVINGTLQAFASGSKTRISKPVQFLCPARCCTVVCSRRC
jgi:hypothetical protein